jgi:putative peptidoglycan lipid II flippase
MSANIDDDNYPALEGQLVRGIGVVGIFVGIASALRLAQDAAIAWRFGTGPLVDAYYFLLSVAAWPVAVGLSCLTLLIAPVDAHLRSIGPDAARRFRSELLGAVIVLAVVCLPLTWWGLRAVASGALSGLNGEAAALARAGATALAGMISIGLIGTVFSAWLVSSGRHVLALIEGLAPLTLLVFVMLTSGANLFWGTTAGVAVQALVMALVLRNAKELPGPRLSRSSIHWQSFSDGALLLLIGQIAFGLVPLMDTLFAARLGQGTVAAFGYTNRLVVGLQGLAGLALQRSGLPLLARLAVDSPDAARRASIRWATAGALTSAGVGIVIALAADTIVSLLFQRGHFTAADASQCAILLRYGVLQMPFFVGGLVLVTALASMGARRPLAFVAAADVVVKLLTNLLLVDRMGAAGLMLATAVMYAVAAVVAYFALRRHIQC